MLTFSVLYFVRIRVEVRQEAVSRNYNGICNGWFAFSCEQLRTSGFAPLWREKWQKQLFDFTQ